MRKLFLKVLLIVSLLLPSMNVITVQAGDIELKVYTRDEGAHEINIEKPRICIENTGTVAISNFIMYYYFTVENNKEPILERYYQTDPNITTLESLGRGNYRVKINPSITLEPGESNEGFVFGLHYGDWSLWDKGNDFSHISTSTYVINPKVLVVDSSGNIIYGEGMPEETTINVTNSSTSGVTGFIDVHPGAVIRDYVDKELYNFCTSPRRVGMNGILKWGYTSIKSFYVLMPKDAILNITYTAVSPKITSNYSAVLAAKFGTPVVIDPYVYDNRNYPQNLFEQVLTTNVEGVSMALVKVNPIQYNPVTDVLTEYTRINFQFDFTGGSGFNMPDGQYRDIINNTVINPQITASTDTFQQRERGEILIIANDLFASAVNRFAQWKRQMGFDVTIESRSSWPSADVQAFTASRASNPPDYIILFGDHPYVESKSYRNYQPGYISSGDYYSDYSYFFSVSGTNQFPQSATARIPVTTPQEADDVVNKIIYREQQPPTSSTYYSNILTAAMFQDEDDGPDTMLDGSNRDGYEDLCYTQTAWEIGKYLSSYNNKTVDKLFISDVSNPTNWNNTDYSYGEAIPAELLNSGFPWNIDGNDHVAALNSGRMLGIYRGHGNYYSAPAGFNNQHVALLNNLNALPVLFFINCYSGAIYDRNSGDITSISESLLRKSDGGAVGVLASTNESVSGANDAFIRSIVNSIWPEPGVPAALKGIIDYRLVSANAKPKPMDKIGYAILQGHIQSRQSWDGIPLEIYHYYGDPSMEIDQAPPAAISASMPDIVDIKSGKYNIYWSSITEGIVTLSVDSSVIRAEIGSGGTAELTLPSDLIPASSTRTATITITSKHCRPFIKNIVLTNTP
jgi:hypothetical protein